jgi:hypothetical protein
LSNNIYINTNLNIIIINSVTARSCKETRVQTADVKKIAKKQHN